MVKVAIPVSLKILESFQLSSFSVMAADGLVLYLNLRNSIMSKKQVANVIIINMHNNQCEKSSYSPGIGGEGMKEQWRE
jgi:hypothetical protein